MTVSKDLRELTRDLLTAAGVATTGQVFFSRTPATPDQVITVTVYPVPLPNVTGVQVRVRGKAASTVDAEDWADRVKDALHGVGGRTQGGTILDVLAYVSGARLGVDANNRDEVALNFYATASAPSTSLVDVD